MPNANDAVWISVLPDMSGFGPALSKGAGKEVDDAGESLGSRMGGKMKMALAAGGVAIGAALTKGLVDNINIGKANDKLAAQLGVSAKESSRIGKVAGDLYRDAYGDSIEQVNEAVQGVMKNIDGMSTASSKDLERVTASVLDVSTAFDQDLGMTTAAVGQLMKTGMAKDATEALDIITKGLQSPANKADDLLETMNEYGTQFRKMGLDGRDAMGLLSQGLAAGARDADIVADAIKEFSIRTMEDLEKTNAQGELQMTALGAAFRNVLPAGKDMYEVQGMLARGGEPARKAFDMMTTGLRNIKDPADRTKTAVALFGTQAEDLGDALYALDLDTAASGMGQVEGAAAKMGKTLNDNFATRMETWKRTAMGFVQDGIMKIADAGIKVTNWAERNKGVLTALGVVIGGLTLVTAAHALAVGISTGALKKWVLQTAIVTTVTKTYTAVQWLLNAALSANPIGLVVAALALLAAGLVIAWKRSETFRNVLTGAWDVIKRSTQTAVLWVADKVLWMAEKILGAMEKAFGWAPGIGEKLRAAQAKVQDFREEVNAELDKIADEDINIRLSTDAKNVLSGLKGIFGGSGGSGGSGGAAPRRASGGVGGAGGPVFKTVTNTPQATKQVQLVGTEIDALADQVSSTLSSKVAAAVKRAQSSSLGPMGKAGRVLPAGSYSIGMPYLGYPGHYGADYPAPGGTPVYSPWPGRVSFSGFVTRPDGSPSYGNTIKIDHNNGMSTLYAHLSARSGVGPVAAGSMIGRVGTTGNSTGNHLHFEARRGGSTINPASLGLFDSGGILQPGALAYNGLSQPEVVFTPQQWSTLRTLTQTSAYSAATQQSANADLYRGIKEMQAQIHGDLQELKSVTAGAPSAIVRGLDSVAADSRRRP